LAIADNAQAQGFAPVARSDARLLILGSMPGQASLQAQAYYAHPRNAFWRILADVLGFPAELPYAERLLILQANGIALWDVLAACHRPGSLDADIDDASIVVNDFAGFLQQHPHIRRVCFNGAKAEQSWRKQVQPLLDLPLELLRLPSTSPAHAGMPYEAKRATWANALTQQSLAQRGRHIR
jgi:TDG/mug DNA glycosylase family protein